MSNSVATGEYLRLQSQIEVATRVALSGVRTRLEDYANHVSDGCRDVAATGRKRTTINRASEAKFWQELVDGVTLITFSQLERASGGYVRRLKSVADNVRWRNIALNRLQRAIEEEEDAWLKFLPPQLCRDLGAWREKNYERLPKGTVSFLRRWEDVERSAIANSPVSSTFAILPQSNDEILLAQAVRYAGAAGGRLARRVMKSRLESSKAEQSLIIKTTSVIWLGMGFDDPK